MYYEPIKHTAGVEQAKHRRRVYGTYIESVAEFSKSLRVLRLTEVGATTIKGDARDTGRPEHLQCRTRDSRQVHLAQSFFIVDCLSSLCLPFDHVVQYVNIDPLLAQQGTMQSGPS
jgi:hypothetical protein